MTPSILSVVVTIQAESSVQAHHAVLTQLHCDPIEIVPLTPAGTYRVRACYMSPDEWRDATLFDGRDETTVY